MIYEHKLSQLTEEEIYILIHILTENSEKLLKWHTDYFKALRPTALSNLLDVWSGKMKEENRHKIDSIRSKLL